MPLSPDITTGLFLLGVLVIALTSGWWVLRGSVIDAKAEEDRADLTVYEDQLGELAQDLKQGRIAEDAFEAGRLEIGRRLLRARDRVIETGFRLNKASLGGLAAVMVIGACGLYFWQGSPHLQDEPFSQREHELLTQDPSQLSDDAILVLLQSKAQRSPKDPMPHILMGQILSSAGRDQDALRAFQAALRRDPRNADVIAETAAVLMRLNDNKIGPDAKDAFDTALKIDPTSASALFYLGFSDWQSGQKDKALTRWRAAFVANAQAPQKQKMLAARIAEVLSQLDRGPQSGDGRGMEAMQNAGQEAQKAFIANMVNARIERLRATPNDPALRLSVARVQMMTGQADAAAKTLQAGLNTSQSDPLLKSVYQLAMESLGLAATGPTSQ